MSVRDERHLKVLLPRRGADRFWRTVMEHYAGRDRQRWRLLAMLALRESADWPLKYLGFAFGCSRGHVGRSLEQLKQELRERFAPRK